MIRVVWQALIILALTLLTQIGGLIWLAALILFRRRTTRLAGFLALYAGASLAAQQIAPLAGRTALPCTGDSAVRAPLFYCALNRTYVTPELATLLGQLAAHMEREHPGIPVTVLDGGFPFLTGFPLLPHLSHDDGEKVDLAFWYEGGGLRSPIGYWAFEDGPAACPDPADLTLRWDMHWFQPFTRDLPLDKARMTTALRWLNTNLPASGKILVEPHLASALGVSGDKIRFQGCRAARHDDHIHIQL
ncbi:MAG: hypothetical protein OIF48_16975 [Silicimonas sp.]|nr:hypothetical protein [Silicimonas sp.]